MDKSIRTARERVVVMTTLELVPLVEETSTDDDAFGHWYCLDCYPEGDVAFCGENLDPEDAMGESDGPVDCPLCLTIDTCPKCDW